MLPRGTTPGTPAGSVRVAGLVSATGTRPLAGRGGAAGLERWAVPAGAVLENADRDAVWIMPGNVGRAG